MLWHIQSFVLTMHLKSLNTPVLEDGWLVRLPPRRLLRCLTPSRKSSIKNNMPLSDAFLLPFLSRSLALTYSGVFFCTGYWGTNQPTLTITIICHEQLLRQCVFFFTFVHTTTEITKIEGLLEYCCCLWYDQDYVVIIQYVLHHMQKMI